MGIKPTAVFSRPENIGWQRTGTDGSIAIARGYRPVAKAPLPNAVLWKGRTAGFKALAPKEVLVLLTRPAGHCFFFKHQILVIPWYPKLEDGLVPLLPVRDQPEPLPVPV